MSHTPGPWEWDCASYYIDPIDPLVGRGIARMLNSNPNWEANARLIAAAPELLEALHGLGGLLASVEDEPEIDAEILRAIYAARQALAKAEGD